MTEEKYLATPELGEKDLGYFVRINPKNMNIDIRKSFSFETFQLDANASVQIPVIKESRKVRLVILDDSGARVKEIYAGGSTYQY